MHCLKAGLCKQEGIGVGKANIFCGGDYHSSGYKERVFATLYHSGKPIYRTIWVRAANALYKCGDNVVVLLAIFVVERCVVF